MNRCTPARVAVWLACLAALVLGTGCPGSEPDSPPAPNPEAAPEQVGEPSWPMFGHDLHNTRHQPDERWIDPASVKGLKVKWAVPLQGNVLATPSVVDDAVYVPDTAGFLYKLDAATGATIWSKSVAEWTGTPGDTSRSTPAVTATSLLLGTQNGCTAPLDGCARATMLAIDKETGALQWKQRIDDFPGSVVTQSPVVWLNKVLVGVSSGEEGMAAAIPGYECCSFRGKMVGLDARSGELLKSFHTVPDVERYSGGAIWGSTAVVDFPRDSIYITTGNNYSVPLQIEDCIAACVAEDCETAKMQACTRSIPGNHMESIIALDGMFEVKWSFPAILYDASNYTCFTADPSSCPKPMGPDFDFGQGPMLIDVAGTGRQILGAGQKSGIFWALDPDTGALLWQTRVGPGGNLGGMQWGSATDGKRIYTASANAIRNYWELKGQRAEAGFVINRGFWSALDPATGEILWQTPEPDFPALRVPVTTRDNAYGPRAPVSVANGVVFVGTTSPGGDDLFALDGETGAILWSYATGATVSAGAAVVDGSVYWGALAPTDSDEHSPSTYHTDEELPPGNATFFAFCIPGSPDCPS